MMVDVTSACGVDTAVPYRMRSLALMGSGAQRELIGALSMSDLSS
jgi:hypothetical protein